MIDSEFLAAYKAIGTAKLIEFRSQSLRIAGLVQGGTISHQLAVDELWTLAESQGLTQTFGIDRIECIVGEAFAVAQRGAA